MIDKSECCHKRGEDDPAAIGIPTVPIQTSFSSNYSPGEYAYSGVHGNDEDGKVCVTLADVSTLNPQFLPVASNPKAIMKPSAWHSLDAVGTVP